jgi:hypothetical protein
MNTQHVEGTCLRCGPATQRTTFKLSKMTPVADELE